MTVGIDVEAAEVEKAAQAVLSVVLLSGTKSVRAVTRGLEKQLEATTRQGVKGNLWRAWKSEVYPSRDVGAYDPVGEVFVNGRSRTKGAMTYWTQPGINRAKDGYWLAIPTEHAGVLNRSRNLSPGEWERRNGVRLKFVYQGAGKPALLMAEHVLFGANGTGIRVPTRRRARSQRYINRDGTAAKLVDVPIFVLIPSQRFANKVSIDAIVASAGAELVRDFEIRIRKALDR